MRLMELIKKKIVPRLVAIKVDDTPQFVSVETIEAIEKGFLNPTPENPQIGVCKTCAPDRIRFLNELRDLENDQSCFMLNHEVEPLAGIPWHLSQAGRAEQAKEMERVEFEAWKNGETDL